MRRVAGKRMFLVLCLLFLAAAGRQTPAAAAIPGDERILSFSSDITVHSDSSMTVKETITVRAAGVKIRRGIYRDFPTTYRDLAGNRYTVGFSVADVLKNDAPEPRHEEALPNGTRVYMGDKDTLLRPGVYTYTLVYSTDRQLGFFSDHDELYWNVTGNGWEFPIDKASATVALPQGVAAGLISSEGYTGLQGDKGRDYSATLDASGIAQFVTTRPLGPREGLTIVVAWPKGHVRQPDIQEKTEYFFRDHGGKALALLGLIAVIVYYLSVWARAGRDPVQGVIVTRYTPPDGMTPAVMRYITKMRYDDRTLASAIIDMAVKGHLAITENDGTFTLKKQGQGKQPLSFEEEKVMRDLLGNAGEIVLTQSNHGTIGAAIKAFRDFLALKYEKIYFVTNRGYFLAGLGLAAVFLVLSGIWEAGSRGRLPIFLFICFWLSIWTVGVLGLVNQVAVKWRHAIRRRGISILEAGGALFITLFSLPFIAGEIAGISVLGYAASPWTVVFAVLAGLTSYIFYHLLKAPTRAGRTLLDAIEGFSRFLAATEKDRLNMLHPPERTPELFERYLPYALALDIEQQWAEQFADVLSAARVDASGTYSPVWFSGRSFSGMTSGDFASSLSDSFSGAIASSSTAPGSSSGSGGGGSSGGGGGGGGGGGW